MCFWVRCHFGSSVWATTHKHTHTQNHMVWMSMQRKLSRHLLITLLTAQGELNYLKATALLKAGEAELAANAHPAPYTGEMHCT